MLSTMNNGKSDRSKVPVKVIVFTGIASFNINSTIVHLTLLILIVNNKRSDLDGNKLKQLQKRLKDIIYFIIDEKSMIGKRMFILIDKRLREAFSKNRNNIFGRQSIILFSDFSQFLSVLDFLIYAN